MTVALIQSFAVTVPAATAIATPQLTGLTLQKMQVSWVEWRVPPGPNGTVGFYLSSHGAQMLPWAVGTAAWIIANDESEHWDLVDQMDSGDWQLTAYNTGNFPHTIQIRFGLVNLPPPPPAAPTLIPAVLLSSPGPSPLPAA